MVKTKRWLQLGTLTLATSLTIAMSGCGTSGKTSGSASAASNGGSSNSSSKSSSAKKSSNQTLVFYSAEGFDSDIAKAFQKKTGIKVKMVDMSTGPLLAKVQAEKDNPQWDVAWFDGPSSMQSLDNQGMLYKGYTPANTKNYTSLGKKMVPKDHAFFPVTVTAADAIGYNTKLVKNNSDLPQDWSDLTKSKYKGAFAMNNPSISGPTYPAVYGLMNMQGGISQGKTFFKNLKANGMHIYDSNGPTLQNLEKGNVKYAIAQDSAIIEEMKAGKPVKIIYPKSGVTTLSSNIGIDKKSKHLAAAKKFVNYVLSVEGQKVCSQAKTGDANFKSIIQGAPGRQGIRPSGITWHALDPVAGAQHENAIKQWFNQNIVQK